MSKHDVHRYFSVDLLTSEISSFVALFIVLTAVLAAISFVLEQTPTVANMYNSVHCLFFVVIFIFLATKVRQH